MPVFVPIVIAGISTGISVAQIVMTVGSALYGRNRAASAKRKAARAAREQAEAARAAMNLKFNATNLVANIPVIYGPTRIGGYFALQEVSPDKKFLHLVVVHAEGVCEKGELYLDDTPWQDAKFTTKSTELVQQGTVREWSVNPNFLDQNDPAIIAKYSVETPKMVQNPLRRSLVHWEFFSGTDDQAACQTLIDALPGKWTAAHKLSGVCYSYVRLEFDPDVWKAIPTITVSTNGKRVIDPRTYQSAPSSNPALALRDYLLSERYGRGLSASEVNDVSFAAAANYCDQAIFMGHPNTVPRYAIGGLIDTAKACTDNVQELLEHMRGELQFSDGVYSLVIDKAEAPVMSFDVDNLVGKLGVKKPDRRDRLNQLQARFIDPSRNYEESVVTVKNADWRQEDGGILLESQRDYSLAQDERRARYLLERELRDSRNGMVISFVALPVAARLQPLDVFTLSHPSTGWVNKQFRAITVKPLPNGDVEVTAREYDAGLYVENPLGALPPPPASNLPDPFAIMPAPAGLTVTTENQTLWSGEVLGRFKVTWQPVNGLLSDYLVRWRKQSETVWQELRTRDTLAHIPAIPNGPYFVSVAAVSSFGRVGNDTTVEATLTGPSGVLPDVTGLTCVLGSGGEFVFNWKAEVAAKQYAIEIVTSGVTRRSAVITDPEYTYTLAMNKADAANRTVTIRVKAISAAGLASANWVSKTETNNPPPALAGLAAWSNSLNIAFTCLQPTDADLAGVVCHLGDTANFAPSQSTLAYQGKLDRPTLLSQRAGVPLEVGKTYYLKAAAFDYFGTDGLTFSSSLEVKIFSLSASILEIESIGPEKISPSLLTDIGEGVSANSAIQNTALPKVVATKPSTKVADVVFVTADKTLYRWDGTKYIDSVAAASLTGKVAKTQLETSVVSDIDKAVAYESRIAAVETGKASATSLDVLESKVTGLSSTKRNYVRTLRQWVVDGAANTKSSHLAVDGSALIFAADDLAHVAASPLILDVGGLSTLTLSFDAYSLVAGKVIRADCTDASLPSTDFVLTTAEKRHTVTWQMPRTAAQSSFSLRILSFTQGNSSAWRVYNVKLEASSSPTLWSPHPADSDTSGLATDAELAAQITRIDNVITDVAGKASASSLANLEAAVNNPTTGLNSKASAASVTSLASTVNGKADASQLSSLESVVNHATTGLATKASQSALNSVITDVAGKASATSVTNLAAQVAQGQSGNLLLNADFLLPQPSVNAAPVGWAIQDSSASGSRTQGVNAANKTVLPSTTAGTWWITQNGGTATGNHGLRQDVAIEQGKTYCASAYVADDGVASYIRLEFLDAAGAFISGSSSSSVGTALGGGALSDFDRLSVTAVAPSNARRARFRLIKNGAVASPNSVYFTRPMLEVLPAGQTTPTEWRAGQTDAGGISATASQALSATADISGKLASTWQVTLNAQGKISGVKAYNDGVNSSFDIVADVFRVSTPGSLAAGEAVFSVGSVNGVNKAGLRGDMLIDGSLNAKAVAAGLINADMLGANSVTSNKIAAGAITADKIAAGAITTDKLTVGSTSGARMEMSPNQLRVYDAAGRLRVRLGVW